MNNPIITVSHDDVYLWLKKNKSLGLEERFVGVHKMLEGIGYAEMRCIAAMALVTAENENFRSMRVDNELPKFVEKIKRDTETEVNKANVKMASIARAGKYARIEEGLRSYWQKNIERTVGNNEAARKLMRTDIYNKAEKPSPELATIAGYVGKWKK